MGKMGRWGAGKKVKGKRLKGKGINLIFPLPPIPHAPCPMPHSLTSNRPTQGGTSTGVVFDGHSTGKVG
jgi:hypothetical protein